MKTRAKTPFGEFLVDEIKRAGMSQEEFYTSVGIKKPYFYDLLASTPPPTELQDRMLTVLEAATGTDAERRTRFYDLAAQSRNEIPADITKLIADHPAKMAIIRETLISLLATQT